MTNQQLNEILDNWLSDYKDSIIQTIPNPANSNGKNYSSTSRSNVHTLNDGTTIKEGIRWSHTKECNEPYFLHLDMFGEEI